MKYQLDLFGVIVPSLLLWAVVAYALARVASRLIAGAGLYRHVWHAALWMPRPPQHALKGLR